MDEDGLKTENRCAEESSWEKNIEILLGSMEFKGHLSCRRL